MTPEIRVMVVENEETEGREEGLRKLNVDFTKDNNGSYIEAIQVTDKSEQGPYTFPMTKKQFVEQYKVP